MLSYTEWLLESETKEMKDWFIKRTNEHVKRVQHYCKLIEDNFPDYKGLSEIAAKHDANKFKEPQLTPYYHITWKYKMLADGKTYDIPEDIDDNAATTLHVKTNKHHPEYWDEREEVISKTDRDSTLFLIDGTNMPPLYIAEMCGDWAAMSSERGGKPQDWAKKNINIRWKFTEAQEEAIYKILNSVWK